MDTKQEILRRYLREGDSERKIARDLQLNRKTVKKHLLENLQVQKTSGTQGNVDIQERLLSVPSYDVSHRAKRKLVKGIEDLIKEQMQENDRKKRNGLRKQIKRKVDIHEYLLGKGYKIGYTTVCNYIREHEIATREAFIRQEHHKGEECEFDWGKVKLNMAGEEKRLYMAMFTTTYGNYRYGNLYSRQDTLAFMESHNDFYAHVGGVHHEMVYDNMRVAVAEFVGRHEKTPTKALINLSGWYHFRWRFCNVRKGNEKGHVERSVEMVRRKAFSDRSTFDSYEQALDYLTSILERLNGLSDPRKDKSPQEMLQEEVPLLWKYPGSMECYLTEFLKVDKYSTFCYGTNHYSVPDYLVSHMVEVKIYANQLKVYADNTPVCRHERKYGMYQWEINLEHYLKTLSRKPGALHGSVALEQAPGEMKQLYQTFFTSQPRSFIDILLYCQDKQAMSQRHILR
jgi:transposase